MFCCNAAHLSIGVLVAIMLTKLLYLYHAQHRLLLSLFLYYKLAHVHIIKNVIANV